MEYEDFKDRYKACEEHYNIQYEECEEDWRFVHGEGQWDSSAEKSRKRGGKPILVLNQLMPYVDQVVNDIRQARLAIRVSPVDSEADVGTAEILSGIIRNVERNSNAQAAYTTASNTAVGAGIGFIRLGTKYEDDDSFDQEPYIDRILDFQSVYMDPSCESLDGSDAEYCFITTSMLKERFEELYPDADPQGFKEGEKDEVCVVEHYYKDYKNDTLYRIRMPDGSTITTYRDGKNGLDEQEVPYEILMEREVKLPTVYHCIYGAEEEPLEETEFPSKYIPIVPVIGKEVFIDGKREFHSLIRQAKDAQKMYNYHKSESTHILALQPKAPVVGPKGSFASYADKWANANRENFSTLEYDIVYDENGTPMPAPSRMPPVEGSQTLIQEAMGAREDIRLALGMPQANMGEAVGNLSGIAIRNKQIEGDNATFHFVDNLAASITQVGRILVDMIPRLYSEAKIMRIIGEDGQEENVPVNQPYTKGEKGLVPAQGQFDGIYDLTSGKYDVVCDVGASYSSKRQETADKLIQLVSAKPEIADITADLLFEALDLPMSREIAERIRTSMDPALLGDDPQAAKLQQAGDMIKQLEERLMNYEAALQDKSKNTQFEQQAKTEELRQANEKLLIEAQKTAQEIRNMQVEAAKTASEIVSAGDVKALMEKVTELAELADDQRGAIEIMLNAKERELKASDEEEMSEPEEDDTD